MRWHGALWIYRLVLPALLVVWLPGWVLKMLRRGGRGTALGERVGIFRDAPDFEPCGAVHVHAVSVGEALLGLKLIRAWQRREPERRFVLATGTATGHAVATAAEVDGLRVTYAPLDLRPVVRRYLDRFEPSRVVLVEAEAWPHLLLACRRRQIPVALVNARMSPRSTRRYRRFARWLRPMFGLLDQVSIQQPGDREIWRDLGVPGERIHHTGSLKFDPGGDARPLRRPGFQAMLDAFGTGRAVVLAASSHPGEEVFIAAAIHDAAPAALIAIAPRHAERRADVLADLERAGFRGRLRSTGDLPDPVHAPAGDRDVWVIDSTGELRDWTAHADVVVIGKSFLAHGGQNPAEAILAGRPLVIGPHMENFEPLASRLVAAGGALRAGDPAALAAAVREALDPARATAITGAAMAVLAPHDGATERILDRLTCPSPGD